MKEISAEVNSRAGEDESEPSQCRDVTKNSCPECSGNVVHDEEHGEWTCGECGVVVDQDDLDRGPEWRAVTTDERDDRRRVGAPVTRLMHDKGLSTTIGWQDKDAHGNPITSDKRTQIQRLRTWDERFRTKDAHERNLKHALGEIQRMSSALELPENVRETASVLYRRAIEEELLPGRSIEGISTACLYAAARRLDVPRSLAELAEVSRVDKLPIQRAYRHISRELDLQIEPADPVQYVPQIASSLEMSDEAERVACNLLEDLKEEGAHSGKSPVGLAGASLYAASHLTNESLTQPVVSDAAHVSEVTIRNRYKEIIEVSEGRQNE